MKKVICKQFPAIPLPLLDEGQEFYVVMGAVDKMPLAVKKAEFEPWEEPYWQDVTAECEIRRELDILHDGMLLWSVDQRQRYRVVMLTDSLGAPCFAVERLVGRET